MKVSVVIPTTFRDSLSAAIASVEAQTVGRDNIEIVVVADVVKGVLPSADVRDRCDQLVITGGGKGGGGARQIGVEVASSELVAFLDDDDVWLPSKLELQLAAMGDDLRCIIGCRVIQYGDHLAEREVPRHLIEMGEPVQDYLFRARRPSIDRNSFFTSTILTSREILSSVPWNPELRRHQDWDWLIRAGEFADIRFTQVEIPLVRYWTGSPNSISASAMWQESLDWYRAVATKWERRTACDFLSAQVLRYALQARSPRGVREVLRAIVSTRTLPSPSCVVVGFGGVLGRQGMQRAMHATGGKVRG